jgi:hypothetical protein
VPPVGLKSSIASLSFRTGGAQLANETANTEVSLKELSGNSARVDQKPPKEAAESVLFACLLALGGFITLAWTMTLLWGILFLVKWLVD